MKIIADKAIPYARSFFSTLGDVTLLNDRDLTTASISDADCLVIRSVTRVDRSLLDGSRIRCVASAASGADHVDHDYLRSRDIPVFTATGCNARSVAEYVLSCLFVLSEQYGLDSEHKTVGIIGCGHVGGQLRRLLHLIGIETLVYDPLLRDDNNRLIYQELDEVLTSDLISLHVPLTTTGEYPTARMVDRHFLARLKADVILINTARGGVVNERDLIEFSRRNRESRLVLDVWDNEPHINIELLSQATLATPHIAGYSAQAKLNATRMVYEQVCAWSGTAVAANDKIVLPGEDMQLNLSGFGNSIEAVKTAVLAGYDVRTDCAPLREIGEVEPERRSDFFTSLRTDYPFRREFAALQVILPGNNGRLHEKFSRLGFTVAN